MLFSGKNIIVTGATGDLGAAITRRLIAQGANVLAVASDKDALARLITEVSGPGALQTFVADVSDSEQVQGYAARAFELWGKVDGFVNNAGIQTPVRPIVEFPEEDFDRVIGTNLRGVWLGLKYQIRHMLSRDGAGAIVNTSSTAGVTGIAHIALYTASKHAIVGLTKAAALELARSKIRVNAVAPGPVQTGLLSRMLDGKVSLDEVAERVPMGRISQPEEIAEAILWLASDSASYVTGHTLIVDGGLTAA